MKNTTTLLLSFLLSVFAIPTFAQNVLLDTPDENGAYPLEENDADHPCITAAQYELIEAQCAENVLRLGLPSSGPDNELTTSLNWPLRSANGLNDSNYYGISAYVDQNTTAGVVTDYNCGTKTYDSHRGTDISIWPFPFYKMDHDQVEVIAAAAGTIVDKSEGNFDKNCAANSLTANYLVIQHADGSRVLYFHMKKNSLTAKAIGATVAQGEYLGVVGSSGNSSGPHLHFEVWSGSTVSTRVDPYAGPCNLLNQSSWWANQKPYASAEILKTSVHTTDADLPACPATETPNESTCYSLPFQGPGLPAGAAKFYIFMRYETAGLTANLSILNPDSTVFNSWTYTSTNSFSASLKSWTKTLPTQPGTYTFQSSYNGLTCSKKFDVISATITANGPTTFCQGSSVMLSANTASAYLWSTGATTKSITVANTGNYSVTVTNANGCSASSAPTAVTVNPLPPTPSITANGPTFFCPGNSVMLSASAADTYTWTNGATTQNITVSNSGIYIVVVSNANGCLAASAPTTVTVDQLPPVPSITANGPTTFCQGNSVMLSASAANLYAWSNGASTQSITVSNAGNYTVTVTNVSGCSAFSAPTTVTVNPLPPTPIITANGPTSFCQGNSVMLSASAANAYVWSNGASTQSITVSNAGNYSVTVTNANGCSAFSAPTTVTVNPLPPTPIITANGPTSFCQGNSVMLSASAANAYVWSNGASTQSITVSNAGNYSVTVTNANGCSAFSAPTTVSVGPSPKPPNITANGPIVFCEGNSVSLNSSIAAVYLWNTGATTQGITVTNSGNYALTITDLSGCSVASTPIAVTVNPLPPTPTITANGSLLSSSAGTGNQWYWNGNLIPGAVSPTYTATQNGQYTVQVTNANGCSATSAVFNFMNTGVESLEGGNTVIILPNPNRGIFTLEIRGDAAQMGSGELEIYNLTGSSIWRSELKHPTTSIDLSAQPDGIYFVRISLGNLQQVVKVVKA